MRRPEGTAVAEPQRTRDLVPVRSAHGLAILLLGLLVGLSFQGSRGLYETTEGRYAEVGREMLDSGQWLEPRLDHRSHWTKPPATYWAVAGGLALLGENAWGARLANALAFALTGLVVGALGRLIWMDPATGTIAGLVYVTSLFPLAGAAVLSTDTILTLFETLAVFAYVLAWRSEDRTRGGAVFGMWLALGAAFLTKGPPGLLPLLPILVFHVRAGRPFRLARPLAVITGSVLGLWWYALEVATHPGLLSYLVGQEVVARNLTDAFGRNPQWWAPFVIYLPVLVLAPGIWLADAGPAARRSGLLRPSRLRSLLAVRDSPAALLFPLVVIPLVVLSISRSRLPLYVLPLYPAIAAAIARGVVRIRERPLRHAIRVAAAGTVLLITAKGVAALYRSDSDMERLATAVRDVAGEDASVIAYGESRLYGLQFYMGGRLDRVQREGPGGGPPELVARLGGSRSGDRAIAIVARGANRSTVARVIEHTGLAAAAVDRGRWRILVTHVPAPPVWSFGAAAATFDAVRSVWPGARNQGESIIPFRAVPAVHRGDAVRGRGAVGVLLARDPVRPRPRAEREPALRGFDPGGDRDRRAVGRDALPRVGADAR